MSVSKSDKLKDHISPLLSAMRDFSDQSVQRELEKILVPECQIKMCFPFGTVYSTASPSFPSGTTAIILLFL